MSYVRYWPASSPAPIATGWDAWAKEYATFGRSNPTYALGKELLHELVDRVCAPAADVNLMARGGHRRRYLRPMAPTVSVVIPTRNRRASLERLLMTLRKQECPPDEVLVVDASDEPLAMESLRTSFAPMPIAGFHTRPSVCAQRNLGIRQARGSHVLLCDDDIELPPSYLRRLVAHVEQDASVGAVTGVLTDASGSTMAWPGFPAPSPRKALFTFVFQLTVWGDIESTAGSWLTALPLAGIRRWYRRRGNTWSLAGWPLVTQVRHSVVRAAVYHLGSALVRRDWLLSAPYEERLVAHGIGDNYGVALRFPRKCAIEILRDLPVTHHAEAGNRLDAAATYYHRVLALDYFLRTLPQFSGVNSAFLVWSLVGNAAFFAVAGDRDLFKAALRALGRVLTGRNPLLV